MSERGAGVLRARRGVALCRCHARETDCAHGERRQRGDGARRSASGHGDCAIALSACCSFWALLRHTTRLSSVCPLVHGHLFSVVAILVILRKSAARADARELANGTLPRSSQFRARPRKGGGQAARQRATISASSSIQRRCNMKMLAIKTFVSAVALTTLLSAPALAQSPRRSGARCQLRRALRSSDHAGTRTRRGRQRQGARPRSGSVHSTANSAAARSWAGRRT